MSSEDPLIDENARLKAEVEDLRRALGATQHALDQARLATVSVDVFRASGERLEQAALHPLLGFHEANLDEGTQVVSPELMELLGLQPGARLPPPGEVPPSVHTDDAPALRTAWARALDPSGSGVLDEVYRLRRPDGAVRVVEHLGRVRFSGEGPSRRATHVTGIVRDLTFRRAADAHLRASEHMFRLVVENSRDGINLLDLRTGRYVYMSQAQVRLTGFDANELNDLPREEAFERVHPDDRDISVSQQAKVAAGEDVGPVEYRWKVKSGEYRWFSDSRRIIRDPSGAPAYLVGVSRDITEQKRVEQALKESEEHFRTLADNISQLAWMADGTGWVFWYNRRWFEYTGTTLEEMQGWGWKAVHHPEHLERVVTRLQRSWDTGEPWEDTFPLRGKDGQYRWFLSRALPIRDARGVIVRWFGTNTDITAQREAEESLREADRRKNHFLALLSHELRNPLAPIVTSLYILERSSPGEARARRATEVIERQTGQLVRLVDDLLDVTRITRDKIQLQLGLVELRDLVRRTVDDHQAQFDKMGIAVEAKLPHAPVWVNGDWNRLAQVVGNLLSNASKFTPRGGRTVVEVAADADAGTGSVRVVDTGVGMSREMLERLFEPFSQADDSLDRSKGGLGLGLALVKGLVELHHGSVVASSDGPGHGSCFVVSLPLRTDVATRRSPLPQPAPAARHRILIIEDNVDAASTLADALTLGGHEVHVAYTGPEGVARARELRPELVLCDIGLPGMDGYGVARALAADESLHDTLLVALSGYALPDDVRRAQEAGFQRHLAKPPDLAALYQLVTEVPRLREEARARHGSVPATA